MFKIGDLIIYIAILSIGIYPFIRTDVVLNNKIKIIYDNTITEIDINKDTLFVISDNNAFLEIELKNKMVRIKDSNCPDRYCVKRGWLKATDNGNIICMPNKVIVGFTKEPDNGIDAITE